MAMPRIAVEGLHVEEVEEEAAEFDATMLPPG
jgi:hypothetical protein